MIDSFFSSLRKRWLSIAVFALVAIFGYLCFRTLSIEAYPDIADTSVQVITQQPGHAAEEVEEQITIPLERELNGVRGLMDAIAQRLRALAHHARPQGRRRRLLCETARP